MKTRIFYNQETGQIVSIDEGFAELQDKDLYVAQCKQFISRCAELPWKEYRIAWDLVNGGYFQIESDLLKGVITKEQIKKVWDIALDYIDGIADNFYIDGLLKRNDQ